MFMHFAAYSPSHPSAASFPVRLERAARAFAATGHELSVPTDALRTTGYTAGCARDRARALNDLLHDPQVEAVMATLGGFNTNGILPHLDYDIFEQSPKPVIGGSDFSAALLALHIRTGRETYFGPALLPDIAEFPAPEPYTMRGLYNALGGGSYTLTPSRKWTATRGDWTNASQGTHRPLIHPTAWTCLRQGHATGTVFGGNIETINCLLGTEFWSVPPQPLVFVEATESEAFLPRFERSLEQLRQAGLFDNARGLLVGRSPDAQAEAGQTLSSLLLDVLAEFDFPIAMDIDFGHSSPTLTLPIGRQASLFCKDDTVDITIHERTPLTPLTSTQKKAPSYAAHRC